VQKQFAVRLNFFFFDVASTKWQTSSIGKWLFKYKQEQLLYDNNNKTIAL